MKTRVVCANLIEKEGKILLIQEAKKSCYGLWNFPAGKLDEGETIEQAALREGKEESGFNLKIEYFIGVYKHPADDSTDTMVEVNVFKSNIIDGELISPNDEIMDLRWFTADEIEKMLKDNQLRKPFILEAVKNYEEKQ